jgi:predicted membrane channel-forming protein YqfA (hemolysin III family)
MRALEREYVLEGSQKRAGIFAFATVSALIAGATITVTVELVKDAGEITIGNVVFVVTVAAGAVGLYLWWVAPHQVRMRLIRREYEGRLD